MKATAWCVRTLLLLALALLQLNQQAMADSRYELIGFQGIALDNVNAFLPAPPHGNDANNLQFQKKVMTRTTEALQAVGYYNARLNIDVVSVADTENWLIKLQVNLGLPTRVTSLDWSIDGEGANDPIFMQRVLSSPIKKGAVFNHGDYEDLKNDIQTVALSLGYLDSYFDRPKVLIDPELQSAAISLHFVTGARYFFGPIHYTETPLDPSFIDRISAVETGDLFSSTQINQLYQDLVNSRYFQSVSLRPDLDARANAEVPVTIELAPRSRNLVSTGIGASTNLGPRLKISWEKPIINRLGHRVNSTVQWSEALKTVSASYQIPLEQPLQEFVTLRTGWTAEQFEEVAIVKQSISVERQWSLDAQWIQTLFMRWDIEKSNLNGDKNSANLYVPGASWSQVKNQPKNATDWSIYRAFDVELSHIAWGSDKSFAKLSAQMSANRMITEPHYLNLRGRLGHIVADDRVDIPPSVRFFTGGDQTVRGFMYNSLGPVGPSGDVIGGKNLVVASAEYAYGYLPNWRSAWFLDMGNAFDAPTPIKVGVGTGIHWLTPVGTVRFEVGYGISEPKPPIRLHISFGLQL